MTMFSASMARSAFSRSDIAQPTLSVVAMSFTTAR
jgi:hypothetical protein